jgi:ABC-2 type transport system permease protein
LSTEQRIDERGVRIEGETIPSGPSARLGAPAHDSTPSVWRMWCYLVWFSMQQHARARQMVWMARGLLIITVATVAVNTANGRWTMAYRREPRWLAVNVPGPTIAESLHGVRVAEIPPAVLGSTPAAGVHEAIWASAQAALDHSGLVVFSQGIVFSVFLSFLLPIWCLSFATEALGAEREGSSLVWLLTRPIPRPAIYLAKYVALLPWALVQTLGGFALICAVAGWPGALAFRLYWPAVLWGTIAFCALYHLMGACFRRAAIVAICYSFFLETILGNMPGYMKRVSLGFYTRCVMFDAAGQYGVQPEKPSVYLPVDGTTALLVLIGLTVVLLAVGMVVFTRTQYQDVA